MLSALYTQTIDIIPCTEESPSNTSYLSMYIILIGEDRMADYIDFTKYAR